MSTSYVPPGATVEVDISNLGWNGDFTLASSGDWLLAIDSPTNPVATNERLTRLILTNSNLVVNGVAIGYADDIYHTYWGGNLKAYVEDLFSPTTIQNLSNGIRQAMSTDPGVNPNYPPLIQVSQNGPSTAILQIQYVDAAGAQQILPTINLANGTITLGSAGV